MSGKRPPRSAQDAPAEQDRAPAGGRQRSVFVYLAILFAAAFLMLLLAYFMQQRSSEEIMGNLNDLRDSMTSMRSLDDLLEENRGLREENEGLEERIAALEQETEEQREIARSFEVELDGCTDALSHVDLSLGSIKIAMALFWQIDEAYVMEDHDLCRELIARMEDYLGTDPSQYLVDAEEGAERSTAERYQEILDDLNAGSEE